MRVTGVAPGSRYVKAAGTAASAERAFRVKLAMFQRGAHVVRAPDGDARVPKGLKPAVLGVTGLDTAPHIMRHPTCGPPDGFVNGRPCSLFYGQVLANHQADFTTPLPKFRGLVPAVRALRLHADRVPKRLRRGRHRPHRQGRDGRDHRRLRGADDALRRQPLRDDARRSRVHPGRPSRSRCRRSRSATSDLCGGNGWYGEETLDVEAVHAMAPGAHVMFYAARSCTDTDFLESLPRIVDDNKASIVTNSWGGLDQDTTSGLVVAYEQIFKQGAMQGIGFMFSSGDDGDELLASGRVQTDYPASDPWVTAVGGTSTAIGAGGELLWQTGWGTDKYNLSANGKGWVPAFTPPFLYGSGGGFSTLFNRPGVPERRRPRGGRRAGRPGRRARRRPDDRHAGRRDADVPERRPLRRVPDRRHEPVVAALRRRAGAGGRGGRRAGSGSPTRRSTRWPVTMPGAFRDVLHHAGGERPLRLRERREPQRTASSTASARSTRTPASVTKKGWDDVTGVGTPTAIYPQVFADS